MGASKQLSNDLKTKIVQHHGLGEGYRKLSQRFKHSVSTVRNIVRNWKTRGTVLVKARSGRPSKISDKQRRRMVRSYSQPTDQLQRPTTSTCCIIQLFSALYTRRCCMDE